MIPDDIDYDRAVMNPWGLTPHQCMTIRLVCLYGGTKRAAHAEDLPRRTLEHHLLMGRKAMKMYGNDVRLYVEFDRWLRKIDYADASDFKSYVWEPKSQPVQT